MFAEQFAKEQASCGMVQFVRRTSRLCAKEKLQKPLVWQDMSPFRSWQADFFTTGIYGKVPQGVLHTDFEQHSRDYLSVAKREFVVRFAIGREGRLMSAVWRIWKGRNNDNIYIAPRGVAGSIKVTMHANRFCHVAFTSQHWRLGGSDAKRPSLVSWVRPDATAEGWVVGVSILFASQFLSPIEEKIDADTFLIESPQPGKAIIVDLIFSRLPPGSLRLPPGTAGELGSVKLASGEHFAVIGSLSNFDSAQLGDVNMTVPFGRVAAIGDIHDEGTRVLLLGDTAVDGHLRILDVGAASIVRGDATE